MKRALPLIYACLASAIPACTGDGTPMFADTDPGSTGDPTTGSGTSGGDTDTEGTTGEPECVYPESLPGYTALREDNGMGGPPGGAVVDGNLDDACPDTFEDDQGVAGGSEFYVYRPAVGMTADWPDQCLPLVVFSPPVGGNPVVMNSSGTPVHTYAHIFDRLAEEGFVVVATQAIGGGMGTGFATNTERAQLAQCAIEWARNEYADYLSDDIALVGHSRGGAAVSIMAPLFASEGLKAVVALAPAVSSGVAGDLEPAPVDPAQAVPYLVIQGNDDEDTTGRGLTNYDFMGVEDRAVDYPIDDYPHDKAMLWAYDARHFVWGGNIAENLNPMVYGQLELDRGHAIAGFYVPAFLRWKVYGWDDERQWFVGPAAYDADASAFPAEVRNSGGTDLWQPLYSQSRFAALGSRPVMLASFSQGVGDEGVRRFRIDTMSRPQDLTCAAPGQSAIFSPSEPIAAPLSEIGFGDACVSTSTNQGLGFHDTNAMELAWGPGDAGDEVRWDIGPPLGSFGLAPYDTLSVRLAKRGAVGTTEDPLEVDVVVETEALDDDGQTIEAAVSYDRVVAQTYQGQSAFNLATALHTTRIPLEDFLSSGQIDLARPRSVALRIPSTGPSSTDMGSLLHVDSLELTGHPLDASTMDLGEDAFWRCEATTALVVTETACDTTPVTGTCPVGSETTTSLALPSVDDTTGSFDGWLVGTHAGWIANPNAPTTTELDGLVQRCVTACEREYEGRPHVSANCADVGVFQSPTRFTAAARMTRRAVPEPFRDGSGIEAGQSLTCDLMDDCCAEFDEDVCPAASMRVTEARGQLERGEEWVAFTGGKVHVRSIHNFIIFDAKIKGTLGWSTCADGNTSAECPFYLGSGHLETIEPLVVDLQCNGSTVQRQLDLLEVDLVQPAFGIDFINDKWKGMPPGAMVLEVRAEVGPFVFEAIEVNQDPVVFESQGGSIKFNPSGGLEAHFDVSCNGELNELEAFFSVNSSWSPHGPPSLSISMPSSVSCGSTVNLGAILSDPQADAGAVRWEVDGVLLDSTITTIDVDTTHSIRATVKDARGATATDTHAISCTVP